MKPPTPIPTPAPEIATRASGTGWGVRQRDPFSHKLVREALFGTCEAASFRPMYVLAESHKTVHARQNVNRT